MFIQWTGGPVLCLIVAFLSLQVMVGRSHHVVQAGDCANIGCTFSSFERSCLFLSPDRLPSLRPKRDLTLGGVPKVSHMHWFRLSILSECL